MTTFVSSQLYCLNALSLCSGPDTLCGLMSARQCGVCWGITSLFRAVPADATPVGDWQPEPFCALCRCVG